MPEALQAKVFNLDTAADSDVDTMVRLVLAAWQADENHESTRNNALDVLEIDTARAVYDDAERIVAMYTLDRKSFEGSNSDA